MHSLVLADGEGCRLRPLTLSVPKHLIPLAGRAMIEYPIMKPIVLVSLVPRPTVEHTL